MTTFKISTLALALGLAAIPAAHAGVGAEQLLGSFGSYTTSGGSLSTVLTDADKGTYALSFDRGGYVDLGWTSVFVLNGAGDDLVLFELGVPDSFTVTINGISNVYTTSDTGSDAGGYNLNRSVVDLSSFGLAAGASISSLRIGMDIQDAGGTVPSLSYVEALNTAPVPEPETYAMLLAGLGVMGALARRRKAQ